MVFSSGQPKHSKKSFADQAIAFKPGKRAQPSAKWTRRQTASAPGPAACLPRRSVRLGTRYGCGRFRRRRLRPAAKLLPGQRPSRASARAAGETPPRRAYRLLGGYLYNSLALDQPRRIFLQLVACPVQHRVAMTSFQLISAVIPRYRGALLRILEMPARNQAAGLSGSPAEMLVQPQDSLDSWLDSFSFFTASRGLF